jgi:hypothetical protein
MAVRVARQKKVFLVGPPPSMFRLSSSPFRYSELQDYETEGSRCDDDDEEVAG